MERVLRFLLAFSRRGARNGHDPLEFELPMTRNEIGGVPTFKGVRYAAPPFGVNRLQPPQAAEPWDGVRDALAFGRKLSNSRHRLRFLLSKVLSNPGSEPMRIWPASTRVAKWIRSRVTRGGR
jgi:hypothetical protein